MNYRHKISRFKKERYILVLAALAFMILQYFPPHMPKKNREKGVKMGGFMYSTT